jgi:hypothetical protein
MKAVQVTLTNNLLYLDTMSLFPTTEVTGKLMNKWHVFCYNSNQPIHTILLNNYIFIKMCALVGLNSSNCIILYRMENVMNISSCFLVPYFCILEQLSTLPFNFFSQLEWLSWQLVTSQYQSSQSPIKIFTTLKVTFTELYGLNIIGLLISSMFQWWTDQK